MKPSPKLSKQEQLKFIIDSNLQLFGIKFLDYKDGRMVFTSPSISAVKEAEENYRLFKERQKAINQRVKPSAGDWVKRLNGEYSRITVYSEYSSHIQLGGTENGSYYCSKSGSCSYSGGCGESIPLKSIKPIRNGSSKKRGSC